MTGHKLEDLLQELERNGAYETDPRARRPPADRLLGRLDLWYYLHVFALVLEANRQVRRGVYNGQAWQRSAFRALRAVELCGGRVSIGGFHNLRDLKSPAVFISNHMSLIETFVVPCFLLHRYPIVTVIKESLCRYPLFGVVMRALDPITVTRTNAREDLKTVLGSGAEALGQGRSVLLFPQATRSAAFDRRTFNTLGVKLALRARVPVVPVAVKTDFQGIGRLKPLRDFGPLDRSKVVHFRFGQPLTPEGSGKAAQEAVLAFIEASVREWGGLVADPRQSEAGP